MNLRSRSLLFALALGIALFVIWQKVRIVFFVPLTPVGFAAMILIFAVVIFLLLDHLLNRSRG
ncbi:MAG: hypothetical protein WAV53_09465 [Anaerolineae bacterium]